MQHYHLTKLSLKTCAVFHHFSQTLTKKFVKNDEFLAAEADRAQAENYTTHESHLSRWKNAQIFKKNDSYFVQNDNVEN